MSADAVIITVNQRNGEKMELVEANGIEDFKFLYELETDPEIIDYYHPNFNENGKMEFLSYDKTMKEYENQSVKKIYIVKHNSERIGTFSVIRDFEYLVKKWESTAWISLAFIKKYHGNQVVKDSYFLFEEKLKDDGYKKIELGVFEFNIRARRFYEKIGYNQIACLKDFTYYNGKWWADYRYEKNI
ncbi:MAG: GNAT family N-acetyltransferase [Fusobacteriales bacterium]|nr:GNAT family N-acetyltransferase [Fusobacteriales bacterium]